MPAEITDSEAASILLHDPASGDLVFEAVPEIQGEGMKQIHVPVASSVAGMVFQTATPAIINDAMADHRIYREVDRLIRFQTRSVLAVPLMIKQEPSGCWRRSTSWAMQIILALIKPSLETLAAQAAISIENARLMAKLQDANQELVRLDRMKSDFIAIASHELRTPLGLILGHATFLTELVDEQHQDQIEVIIRSAERLKAIVEDLARISHQEEGQSRVSHQLFSASELVISVVGRFGEMAKDKKSNLALMSPVKTSSWLKEIGKKSRSC